MQYEFIDAKSILQAAREALEEIERKKQRAEERKERRIALAEEVIEHKTRLKGRVFGFDRNWSQCVHLCPTIVCVPLLT